VGIGLLVGVGVGDLVGVGLGVGLFVGVGFGVGDFVGVGFGVGDLVGVGLGVGVWFMLGGLDGLVVTGVHPLPEAHLYPAAQHVIPLFVELAHQDLPSLMQVFLSFPLVSHVPCLQSISLQ